MLGVYPRPPLQRGLTLLELLLALLLAALLLGLASPAFSRLSENLRLETSTRLLAQDLLFARHTAIVRAVPVVVCPRQTASTCSAQGHWQPGWLAFTDADGDGEPGSPQDLLRSGNALPAGVRMTGSDARTRLRFSVLGTAPGSNASLVACGHSGAARARAVVLSATGRIRRLSAEKDGLVADCS